MFLSMLLSSINEYTWVFPELNSVEPTESIEFLEDYF